MTTLLTTSRFTVEQKTVNTASGGQTHREVVVHPGAVVILPILDDNSIVLIRNYRFACGQTLLELPAGTLEADETPIECAARELVEETGFRAEIIEPLSVFYTSPGIMTERIHAFIARGLTEVGQKLDETESIEVDIHRLDKIRQLIIDGCLNDGKTIAVLATYLLQRESIASAD